MAGFGDFINPQGAAPQVNFQQAGQFQQTLSPQQAPQEGPPTTPQELEQRKSGWQEFMTNLQTDPAMRQAALLTAAQMMRGTNQGESFAGGLGRALQVGTLAHGFFQGNQNQQAIEQQKLAEQQRMNDASIGQTVAQTDGLRQQQDFAAQGQPGVLKLQEQRIGEGDFAAGSRDILLKDQLATSASKRKLDADHGSYYTDKKNTAGASTSIALDREDRLVRQANPPMAGESDAAYQQRIATISLTMGKKSQNSVRVQALQKYLSEADPSDPNYMSALDELRNLGMTSEGSSAGGSSDASWHAARASVKVGEKYKGPDGKTYIRKE